MEAYEVDPRYVQVEDTSPRYRVDFWRSDMASNEWRLEGVADVEEVVRWAEEHAEGRSYVVWVEFDAGGRVGLARLLGWELSNPDRPDWIHTKRGQSVSLPSDATPGMALFAIIAPLEPMRVGDQHEPEAFPLHVTVVPPFATRGTVGELEAMLARLAASSSAVTATPAGHAFFGRLGDIPVALIDDGSGVHELHRQFTASLRELDWRPLEPNYSGIGYRPHITLARGAVLPDESEFVLSQLALVSMDPPLLTVVSTSRLGPPTSSAEGGARLG